MEKIPVIVVAGPTASGKTELGVELAKLYDGEIVSADSMQIYKGLDITTAKPDADEMQGVPHHLMSILDRNITFSVADYVVMAKGVINRIHDNGRIPIIVGGTGLYISSLLDNITFAEIKSDPDLREKLYQDAKTNGNEHLLDELRKVDGETADSLHPNNLVRIVRALEIYILTGMTFSEHKRQSRKNASIFDAAIIGLTYNDRQILYDKINIRIDMMLEKGMLDECLSVYNEQSASVDGSGILTAGQAIGYKELIPYFQGKSNLDDCVEKIKLETRHYAKRQLTWFRKNDKINWIFKEKSDNMKKILNESKKIIAKIKNI